jgi:hypothetical protein
MAVVSIEFKDHEVHLIAEALDWYSNHCEERKDLSRAWRADTLCMLVLRLIELQNLKEAAKSAKARK